MSIDFPARQLMILAETPPSAEAKQDADSINSHQDFHFDRAPVAVRMWRGRIRDGSPHTIFHNRR
jgi:hypothetical protein